MPNENKKLSADLRSKRRSKKLTLREAGKEIGISTATISRLENSKEPDVNSYQKACKWLGFAMEKYFIGDIPNGGFRTQRSNN